eukprot:2612613-Amphidinium_carterae.2
MACPRRRAFALGMQPPSLSFVGLLLFDLGKTGCQGLRVLPLLALARAALGALGPSSAPGTAFPGPGALALALLAFLARSGLAGVCSAL